MFLAILRDGFGHFSFGINYTRHPGQIFISHDSVINRVQFIYLWGFFCEPLTQVVGTGPPLRDVNKGGPRRDVQDLVVAEGNADILEGARHLLTSSVPPPADAALVQHRAGAQDAVAALRLVATGGESTHPKKIK